MTAKQDVYLAVQSGKPDWNDIRKCHPGFRKRVVGKGIIQIKFRESDEWVELETFMLDYPESFKRRLNDLVLAASKVILPGELLSAVLSTDQGLLDEFQDIIRQLVDEEVSNLREMNQAQLESIESKTKQLEEMKVELEEMRSQILKYSDEKQLINSLIREFLSINKRWKSIPQERRAEAKARFQQVGVELEKLISG